MKYQTDLIVGRPQSFKQKKDYHLIVSNFFKNSENLVLPEKLRDDLRKPLGKVFKKISEIKKSYLTLKFSKIITVGDIVSFYFLKNKIFPDILIYDLKTRRGSVGDEIKKTFEFYQQNNFYHFPEKTVNQQGKISFQAFLTIKNNIQKILTESKKQMIYVEGEEDLLALPVILLVPLNSLVFYGHFQLGIIGVLVDDKIKNRVLMILKKFRIC